MINLQLVAVRYRLGMEDAESLVRLADALLNEGRDLPSAVQLFLLESPVMEKVGPLFERLCVEAGIVVPTKDAAINHMIRHHLEVIAAGSCSPYEELKILMREIYEPHVSSEPIKKYVGDSRGLGCLIGEYHAYDDLVNQPRSAWWSIKRDEGKYAEAVSGWEEAVRQHARDWLKKHLGTQ